MCSRDVGRGEGGRVEISFRGMPLASSDCPHSGANVTSFRDATLPRKSLICVDFLIRFLALPTLVPTIAFLAKRCDEKNGQIAPLISGPNSLRAAETTLQPDAHGQTLRNGEIVDLPLRRSIC